MNDLVRRTAAELVDALAAGETSSVEITQAHLDRIAEVDGQLHAFLHVDAEGALRVAAESDARRATGETWSPLDGIPIAVKDVIATRGLPTTCGSRSNRPGGRSPRATWSSSTRASKWRGPAPGPRAARPTRPR